MSNTPVHIRSDLLIILYSSFSFSEVSSFEDIIAQQPPYSNYIHRTSEQSHNMSTQTNTEPSTGDPAPSQTADSIPSGNRGPMIYAFHPPSDIISDSSAHQIARSTCSTAAALCGVEMCCRGIRSRGTTTSDDVRSEELYVFVDLNPYQSAEERSTTNQDASVAANNATQSRRHDGETTSTQR
jgi:hypothetical protein